MWFTITDRAVLAYVAADGSVTKELIDDEQQSPAGALWAHVESMVARGLLIRQGDQVAVA